MTDRFSQDVPQRMTPYQVLVVAICVFINVMDGFDILSVAFAAPAIGREWGLRPEQLGILLSSGLAGIAVGALGFAILADIYGRRPIILVGVLLMSAGMIAASFAGSLAGLVVCRVATGLGIGGMVSTAGTLAIEYSARRWRTLAVALVVVGYPFGAAVGGVVAAWLLERFGWRSIFFAGGAATACLFPLLCWRMPESIAFLSARQPRNAVARINRYRARMAMAPIPGLPAKATDRATSGLPVLFSASLGGSLALLCAAYALFMFSFYFIINWAALLITRLGLPDTAGVTATALMNGAGVAGGIAAALLARGVALQRTAAFFVALMAMGIALFGTLPASMAAVSAASLLLGFCMWGGSSLAFSVIAMSFPAGARATGIGLVITVGRLGSILGPYAAGLLLGAGLSAGLVTLLLAIPAALCAPLLLHARLVDD